VFVEVYGGSLFWAFVDIFPGVHPWQVDLPAPKGYWSGEEGRARAREATYWLLSQLGHDPTTGPTGITAQITGKHFARMGLRGMIGIVYGDSARRALADVLADMHQQPSC
jgi:hypothetical protein